MPEVIKFVLLLIGAYLLGSVPSAYLVTKWRRGIDIRQYGSGNVGASNVLATVSKRWAIPVTVFDIGKGALTVWVAQLLGFGAAQQITAGIVTIIGHNWPVFLKFRGGRGIYTSLGVVTMLSPKLGLIMLVLSYTLAPIRQVAVGVFIALASLPIFSWFLWQPLDLDIEARLPITMGFIALAGVGLMRRLTAPKTLLSKSVPLGQLFVNRLFFDRDIRDRHAWTRRTPSRTSSAERRKKAREG